MLKLDPKWGETPESLLQKSLVSQWKCNPGRILNDQELKKLKEVVCHHPREVGINKSRWAAKAIAAYVKKHFGKKIQ